MENQVKKKLLENKMTVIIGILCFIGSACIIGYTYSFFAATVSDAVTIKGDAASPSVNLTISRVAPTEDKKLIPQLDAVIHKAVIGTQGNCLDDNNNAICQVYKVTVTNVSAISTYINGRIELDAKDNPHLKWAIVSGLSNTTLVSDIKTHEDTILTSSELYDGGEVKDYYVVLWISETGAPQTDSGSFNGTVTIENIATNPALATLTRLGLDDEVRTNTLNFVQGSFVGSYEEVKSDTEDECINYGGYDTLEECMQDNWGYDTFDEYFANYYPTTDDTGIYIAEDDIGTSYYFRGNVTNNYVKFGKYTEAAWQTYNYNTGQATYGTSCTAASGIDCRKIAEANDDMYWRIVRINGDGTIRMVYAGTSAHDNGVERESIGGSAYNIDYNDNAYVGYMYGATGQSTYANTHANTNNSTIKTTIDTWYSKYLNANYSQFIADAIYCNDRPVVTDDSKYKAWWEDDTKVAGNGIGASVTMYGTWARIETEDNYYNLTELNPTLKCEQANDRFTKVGSTITTIDRQGTNQKLTYPIGLLTADETIFAGGTWRSNYNYYLYTGNNYWTMSPSYFGGDRAFAFIVRVDGDAPRDGTVNGGSSVFPAISLSSTAITGGLGTAISPFTVSP